MAMPSKAYTAPLPMPSSSSTAAIVESIPSFRLSFLRPVDFAATLSRLRIYLARTSCSLTRVAQEHALP
jgi:hypothetical protein